MADQADGSAGRPLGGRRAFVLIAGLAFAGCFLLSELGTAKHLRWLMGWPPLLFVFTVPPEYRWRFAGPRWAREIFIAMTTISWIGLGLSTWLEVAVFHVGAGGPHGWRDIAQLLAVIVLGGVLFGALSLFSAWGLYSVFYRADGPAVRGRSKPWRPDR